MAGGSPTLPSALAKQSRPDYDRPGFFRGRPQMVATGVRDLAPMFARRRETPAWERLPGRSVARSRASAVVESIKSLGLGVAVILLVTNGSSGGVLSDNDFKKVEVIKPLFQNLMGDLVQTSRRTDISSGDSDCIKSTIQELLQISEELSSYEYLITIEKEMTDFGDNNPMRSIIKFAVDKSNTILTTERKRLGQLSDQCARYPLSFAKMQQTLKIIDATTDILNSIQTRL